MIDENQTPGKLSGENIQSLEAQGRVRRLKLIRIVGIVLLLLIAAGALLFWRGDGLVPLGGGADLVGPNRIGPQDAPVQVVNFSDFGCPACRAWHNAGIQEQLLAEFGDQISFEFRHFPVITAQSPRAAEAGQCAAEQGAFWQFHDYIFEQAPHGALGEDDLLGYAIAVGLDETEFESCLRSRRYEERVRRDLRAAQDAGAWGTPTLFINGQEAFPSYESMSATIRDLLNG